MNDSFDPQLEALAETIVFAHEGQAELPSDTAPTHATQMVLALALERTAVLVACAMAGSRPVPERLQRRLAAAGLAFCAELATNRQVTQERQPLLARVTRPSSSRTPAFLLGLAAGAALLFALQGRGFGTAPSAGEQRANVLAADTAALRLPWQPGPSPLRGTLQGDVVWSQDRQEGYLTFRGLPPLDKDHRFQLWIVDGAREGAPVDGGLFVITDAAIETIVPVQARLPIGKPAAFVITVEKSPGVVVSKQEHVVALAGL